VNPLASGPKKAKPKDAGVKSTRTIGIWGPHGSSGKSTIAINLAESLTRSGFKVLLVDADLANPSLALMLGRDEARYWPTTSTEGDEFGGASQVSAHISKISCHGKKFDLFAGLSFRVGANVPSGEHIRALLKHLEGYERVIFDLSSPIEAAATKLVGATAELDLTRFLVTAVDELIAVGRPDFLGVHRLTVLLHEVKKLRKDKPTKVVFNQIAKSPAVSAALDAFELLARDRVSAAIARDDRTVSSALRHGLPARMARRSARFVSDIDALARQLHTL
jgi:MinD-like ATPase involved in chromosome partitioning or flagellar assembly